MIQTVIDRPLRPSPGGAIDAIVEDARPDDPVEAADQAAEDDTEGDIGYAERRDASVAGAIGWASALGAATALDLHDQRDRVT